MRVSNNVATRNCTIQIKFNGYNGRSNHGKDHFQRNIFVRLLRNKIKIQQRPGTGQDARNIQVIHVVFVEASSHPVSVEGWISKKLFLRRRKREKSLMYAKLHKSLTELATGLMKWWIQMWRFWCKLSSKCIEIRKRVQQRVSTAICKTR